MPKASPETLELAIALPLGVVANQLMRVEADLRSLNMKTLAFAAATGNGGAGHIAERLDNIREALDRIMELVSDIETDLQPRAANPAPKARGMDERKPRPDRDD